MSRSVRLFQVDAFTTVPYTGNPAAVVLDAERLSDAEMQSIACELKSGDSAFLLPPDGDDHDLRVRFFTPRAETSFVGHASIAAHAVLASAGRPPCRRQKQRSGIVDIDAWPAPPGLLHAFSQPPPPLQRTLGAAELPPILAALGLSAAELDPRCPPVVAGVGGSRALLAVRDGAILARLRPALDTLSELSAAGAPPGFFIYTLTPALAGCHTEARMFCPALGIDEDPVSGNAHAMLAAYLYARGLLGGAGQEARFTGRQGHHLGRPGEVQVRLTLGGGALRSVQVAGAATIVATSTLLLPALAA